MSTTSSTGPATPTAPDVPDVPAFPAVTDDQIRAAITAAISTGNLAEEFDGYEGWSFETSIGPVATALRNAEVFGDYRVYAVLDHNAGEGTTDGGQVLVTVPGGPTLAGYPNDLKHFTHDREATGIDGLVAIGQAIVADATHAVTRLQAWLAGPTGP